MGRAKDEHHDEQFDGTRYGASLLSLAFIHKFLHPLCSEQVNQDIFNTLRSQCQ